MASACWASSFLGLLGLELPPGVGVRGDDQVGDDLALARLQQAFVDPDAGELARSLQR
jgi:hypothetical protein